MGHSAQLHQRAVEVDEFRQVGLVERRRGRIDRYVGLALPAGAEGVRHEFLYCDLRARRRVVADIYRALSVVAHHLTDDVAVGKEGLGCQVCGDIRRVVAVSAQLAGTVIGFVVHAAHAK